MPPDRARSPARRILDERFALGTISLEDYEQRRALLPERSARSTRRGVTPLVPILAAVAVLAVLTVSFALAAAGSRGGFGPMMGPGMMYGGGGRTGASSEPVPGARGVTVVGDEFSFEPSVVRVPARQTVNLRFENRGALFHTLTIAALDFELRADGGDTATGSLRAPSSGRFAIVCAVPGHAAAGMRARLVVTT